MRRLLVFDGARSSLARAGRRPGARHFRPPFEPYVTVDAPVVAHHARQARSTARARRPRPIRQFSFAARRSPPSARRRASPCRPTRASIDAAGKTVIPGIIGLHDHMYYGGMQFMGVSYPRLFLARGRHDDPHDGQRRLVPGAQPQAPDRLAAHRRARASSSPARICRARASGLARCIRSPARTTRAAWCATGPRRA